MTQTIQAVYEHGVLKPLQHLRLKEHERVNVQVISITKWRKALEKLLARVQSQAAKFSAEEIEQDITLAVEEVRRHRRTSARSR